MMSKFNDLLNLRFRQKDVPQQKMSALVERTASGELSSFSGVFRVAALSETETREIEEILKNFAHSPTDNIEPDLKALMAITSEVKAITNQAVILHGERIKRAQDILKKYRDGAFTAWLYAIYGNRQTPYNFLQYYEFYSVMPPHLHTKIDQMPRQAVYTLASREGSIEKKESIVQNYAGQSKKDILSLIRKEFPLEEGDRRLPDFPLNAMHFLKRARDLLKHPLCTPTEEEKVKLAQLLNQVRQQIEK